MKISQGTCWRIVFLGLAGLEMILAIIFHSHRVGFQCMLHIPMHEGPGLQELWKVNKGIGFTGLAAGGLAVAHSALAMDLTQAEYCTRRPLVLGAFVGVTCVVSLVAVDRFHLGRRVEPRVNLPIIT